MTFCLFSKTSNDYGARVLKYKEYVKRLVPCVFDFKKHPGEIDLILHRISKFNPRSI